MKNLKLTNLERMQENEMTQVRGGIFGMGKKFARYGKGKVSGACNTFCTGSCSDSSTRADEGISERNTNALVEGRS
jgi:hypothetical protein